MCEFGCLRSYWFCDQAEAGGSGVVSRRLPGQQGGAETFSMPVPNNKVFVFQVV